VIHAHSPSSSSIGIRTSCWRIVCSRSSLTVDRKSPQWANLAWPACQRGIRGGLGVLNDSGQSCLTGCVHFRVLISRKSQAKLCSSSSAPRITSGWQTSKSALRHGWTTGCRRTLQRGNRAGLSISGHAQRRQTVRVARSMAATYASPIGSSSRSARRCDLHHSGDMGCRRYREQYDGRRHFTSPMCIESTLSMAEIDSAAASCSPC